ncbi:MAG: metallophosphoesterase [Alphaproteobacteria bacterium]|nr:metallophosphoesterase [Alphaproteobacteria bacterium]
MTDPDLITILHISDFHYAQRKAREQGIVVDALIDDLKKLCIGHRKPDLILFTGDLVQAAGVDPHDEAYDFFIERISKATGTSDDRIFLTPGNHDLSRGVTEGAAETHREWRGDLGKNDEMTLLNRRFDAGEYDELAKDKFAAFNDLEAYLRGDDHEHIRKIENAFVRVDRVEALNVDIVTFNTAVFSTGGSDKFDSDERNLAVPEYAIMEAVKALTPGSLRIFTTHHPLASLSEASSRYLEDQITKHAHYHLFGHMHDPKPRSVSGLRGEVFTDQAGAIFTARKEYYNGYSLITIDRATDHTEVLIRSYYKERDEFDEGTDIHEGGKWYKDNEARQHFRKIAAPVDFDEFRAHLVGEFKARLDEEDAAPGGDAELHQRFIEPPMMKTSIIDAKTTDAPAEIQVPVSFDDLVTSSRNAIIYARPEYGRTSLLRELRHRMVRDVADGEFPRLPVIIDFSQIAQNVTKVLGLVRGAAAPLPDRHDTEALLKLGHLCVMVDDVQFDDNRRMRLLRDFVRAYPKARYVFSSNWDAVYRFGAKVNPEMPVRFNFIELQELKRRNMRQLITKFEHCDDVEGWLDRLQDQFREINLPFTAANGTILLEIFGSNGKFAPVNRAVLMEQFVETTLEKAAENQSYRATFDFNNKANLLSYVAAWMARENQYVPLREDVRGAMRTCLDEMGLDAPPLDELMDEFLSAKIFERRSENRVAFRYRGVMEYFIAYRMTVDSAFKEWVMEEDRYLTFVNELLYYAGKTRNDPSLIDLVRDRHLAIFGEATKHLQPIDLNVFDDYVLPRDDDGETIEDAAERIVTPPLTAEEKDEEFDLDIPRDEEGRQEVFRPKVANVHEALMFSLMLYSGMLRNFEHMTDAKKREHLGHIWRSWGTVMLENARFAPRLAAERKIRMNGILYELQAPKGMTDAAVLKQLLITLPHAMIRMIATTMGTEKLRKQLIEPDLEEGLEPKVIKMFRVGLITELRLDETPGAVSDLVGTLRDNTYLLWSFVVHLSHLRRHDRIREDHVKALMPPTASAIADIGGGSKKERSDRKSKQIARLQREQLLLKMKRDKP